MKSLKDVNDIINNKWNHITIDMEQQDSFLGNKKPTIFLCSIHGEFTSTYNSIIKSKHGCPLCAKNVQVVSSSRYTVEERLQSLINKFGNNYTFDLDGCYSSSVVTSYCKQHDSYYKSTIGELLRAKTPCPVCSRINSSDKPKDSVNQFIEKANEVHKGVYDYSKVEYKASRSKVIIVCPVHGDFEQTPNSHIMGCGCPLCAIQANADYKRKTSDVFIEKSKEVHKDKYDYSLVEYNNNTTKVKIICNEHGVFEQSPKDHIRGSGCPSCARTSSKPELDIVSYIRELCPTTELIQRYRPTWMNGKELDIYLPEFNLAIEYNGTSYHHSSRGEHVDKYYKRTYKPKSYHYDKWLLCKENDITLLSIYDFYWLLEDKREIYKSKIKHYLKLDTKVYARKCIIQDIDNSLAFEFYSNNHIESCGFPYKNSKSYGLFYNNELVMCCTIGEIYNQTSKSFKLKLHRICTLRDYTVVGGISKLTKFLKTIVGSFSYQITLSSGGTSLKSVNDYNVLPPRYFWVHANTLEYFHRNYCQKKLLESHFQVPLLDNDTESSYMERLGYLKVFDNGLVEMFI